MNTDKGQSGSGVLAPLPESAQRSRAPRCAGGPGHLGGVERWNSKKSVCIGVHRWLKTAPRTCGKTCHIGPSPRISCWKGSTRRHGEKPEDRREKSWNGLLEEAVFFPPRASVLAPCLHVGLFASNSRPTVPVNPNHAKFRAYKGTTLSVVKNCESHS